MHAWKAIGGVLVAWVVLSLMGCGGRAADAGNAADGPDGGAIEARKAALRYDGALSFQRGAR